MAKSNEQGGQPVETKEVKTGDTFSKNERSTYLGPKGPVDRVPENTINPTPTQTPAPAPVTDQGGGGGGSDK